MTFLALPIVLLTFLTGGNVRLRNGVIEASDGVARHLLRHGAAFTLGHVILARNPACLERSRNHELHHVRQYERYGVFTLPIYWLIAFWLRLRGRHPYLDHPMEPPVRDPR